MNSDRQVPHKPDAVGGVPAYRKAGRASVKGYFFCSLSARDYVPGKPRPEARELQFLKTVQEAIQQR